MPTNIITAQCRYNALNVLTNIRKRHPIARPLVRGWRCFFVDALFYYFGPRHNGTWQYFASNKRHLWWYEHTQHNNFISITLLSIKIWCWWSSAIKIPHCITKQKLIFFSESVTRQPCTLLLVYRQISNIRRTVVCNKTVDHSDVVGA